MPHGLQVRIQFLSMKNQQFLNAGQTLQVVQLIKTFQRKSHNYRTPRNLKAIIFKEGFTTINYVPKLNLAP